MRQKLNGAKHGTEDMGSPIYRGAVGEHSISCEAQGVSQSGVYGSENVGMSNHNAGENPAHRKSKVSWAMAIIPGLVGPKARPKGVVDGHTVNIP